MELIKQIKETENQARDIVEKARKDAVALMEQVRLDHAEQVRQSQKKREEAISSAIAQAEGPSPRNPKGACVSRLL